MTDTTNAATAPQPPARRPIGRPGAVAISIVTTLVGLIVLAWAVLYVTKGRFLRPTFERVVSGLTHREVRVGGDFQFYFAPFELKFLAERMTISNPAWASRPHLFAADSIHMRIAPLSLIWRKVSGVFWPSRFFTWPLTCAVLALPALSTATLTTP